MSLLPYQSPPLLPLDPTHRGALVVIAGAIAGSVTIVGLLIRLYIHLAINPHYGRDDFFLLGAAFVAFCQSILVFVSVSKGFGNSADLIDHGEHVILRRAFFSSEILYLLTLYLTKCCVICIFLKLTPKKSHNRATLATLGLCSLWIVGSLLAVGIKSGITDTRTVRSFSIAYCKLRLVKWQLIVSFDVISEFAIFLLAVHLIRELQMRLRTKLIVLSAFAARLPIIALAITRLSFLNVCGNRTNLTLDLVDASVWTQISINYNVIACTIFALKPFTAAVSTHYGTAGSESLHGSKNNTNFSGNSNSATGSALDNGYSRDLESQHPSTNKSKELTVPKPNNLKAGKQTRLSTSISRSITSKTDAKPPSPPPLPRFSLFSQKFTSPTHLRLKSKEENLELKAMNGHSRSISHGIRLPFGSSKPGKSKSGPDSQGVGASATPAASDAIVDPPAAAVTTTTTAVTSGGPSGVDGGPGPDWKNDQAKLVIKKDIEYTVQYGD